jgi:hypothetical protein
MRGPAIMMGAAATLSVLVLACSTGIAAADGVTLPTHGVPTPTVTVPPLPVPTQSVPVPVPTGSVPSLPSVPFGGSGASAGSTGDTTTGASQDAGPTSAGSGSHPRPHSTVTPMIVGRPGATDAPDDESTPALYRATKAFLAADTKIAALTDARNAMNAAHDGAQRAATSYMSLQMDTANARAEAATLHGQSARLHSMIISDAVQSYQTGQAATDEQSTRDLVTAARLADDAATRAETARGGRHGTGQRQGGARSPLSAVCDGAAEPSKRRPAAHCAGRARSEER